MHAFIQCSIQKKSWCFECCTIPKSPTRCTHTNRIPRDFNNSGKRCHTRLAPKKKAYSISNRARYYRFWPLMSACAPTTVGSKKRMCGVGRRLRYEPTILIRCRWKQQLCLRSSSAASPAPSHFSRADLVRTARSEVTSHDPPSRAEAECQRCGSTRSWCCAR